MTAAQTSVGSTTVADLLDRSRVMDIGIRPLWHPIPTVVGPAFTVRCPPGDNLMLHAAIYRAPAGSVIVVDAGDSEFAVAGGNVCAVAQQRGIQAFVIDGAIRDIGEIRAMGLPVFGRGTMPIPGQKSVVAPLNQEINCGGVRVAANDVVVADEDGVVVIPAARRDQVLDAAVARAASESAQSLDDWRGAHEARISALLSQHGFED